jgi:hypothetical protein
MEPDWDELLSGIKQRYAELGPRRGSNLLRHLANLQDWEKPNSHIQPAIAFTPEIIVAIAVCHPDCGTQELIVDGSTQQCQRCGRLMFRTEVRKYVLADDSQ